MKKTQIALFEQKEVRKVWDGLREEWFFSVIDVVGILSESSDPRNYWKVLKNRLKEEGSQVVTFCNQLKLLASDGKYYKTDCGNTETILRIIQSIPSPKAEPFKQWLASVGYQRIQEIENPELAMDRMKILYEQKGYPKERVDKRVRGIAVRQELTNERKNRGVESNEGYAILTNEITQAAFGMTVQEYKKFKGLKQHNLRDHMTDLELILTMLGEATTTKFHKDRDSKSFPALKKDAKEGGEVAGKTRQDIEKRGNKPISTKENYLKLKEKKRLKR